MTHPIILTNNKHSPSGDGGEKTPLIYRNNIHKSHNEENKISSNQNKQHHNGGIDSDHEDDIVGYMETSRRKRLCMILIIFSVFCSILGMVAVWRMEVYRITIATEKVTQRTANALKQLNKHIHKQIKKMKNGCETTLIIMRHCEKLGANIIDEDGNEHCSYVGYQRAQYIATLFGNTTQERYPLPSHLFALTPSRDNNLNFREYETLQPLAQKVGIMTELINHPNIDNEYFDLLQSGELCGQVTVICWKHEFIPELATALGCGMDQGCPTTYDESEYDQMWIIQYIFHPSDMEETIQDKVQKQFVTNTNNHNQTNNNTSSTKNDDDSNDDDDEKSRRNLNAHSKNKAGQRGGGGGEKNVGGGDSVDDDETLNGEKIIYQHGWDIYGTVSYQRFDPLEFAKSSGKIPLSSSLGSNNNNNDNNNRRLQQESSNLPKRQSYDEI